MNRTITFTQNFAEAFLRSVEFADSCLPKNKKMKFSSHLLASAQVIVTVFLVVINGQENGTVSERPSARPSLQPILEVSQSPSAVLPSQVPSIRNSTVSSTTGSPNSTNGTKVSLGTVMLQKGG